MNSREPLSCVTHTCLILLVLVLWRHRSMFERLLAHALAYALAMSEGPRAQLLP